MKTSITVALVLSLAFPAWSRDAAVGLPPPPPDDENQPQPQASEMGYFEGCFGVPRVGAGNIGIYGEVPIPIGRETAGIPSPAISSGSKDDKAWLLIEVG